MEKYRLKILGLSEVKKKGNRKIQLEKGYVLLYSGVSPGKRAKEGVRVILSEGMGKKGLDLESKVTIIQVYSPTKDSEILEKEEFYAQLQRTVVDAENEECRQIILMCNFNGRTGNNMLRAHGYMGPYSGEKESIIDNIIFSRTLRNAITDVKVIRGAEVGTDHRCLIAKTRLKERSREKHKKIEKIQVKQLADPKIKKKHEELMEQKLNDFKITDDTELNDMWKNLKNIIIETAGEVCEKTKINSKWKRRNWWTEEVK
ncbi:hypothetical protein J437_LFUL004463, partial [Ladona fulva]